jgi:hypothetical protein
MWWHMRRNQISFLGQTDESINWLGTSVQSTTGIRGLRISSSNAGYTTFRSSVKSTGYPLNSPVFTSLPLPCVTVYHHISTRFYISGGVTHFYARYTACPAWAYFLQCRQRKWTKQVWRKIFPYRGWFTSVQTGPGAHPTSYIMNTVSFSGLKRPGRGVDHPPLPSNEVKERVELNFYSTSAPSRPVIG